MLGKLLILFTLVPIAELYLLLELGGVVGAVPAVSLVLVTGLLGAMLAKREGARVLTSWQQAVARGELPQEGVASSVLVLVGGVLLVTPGILTDAFGLAMLIPLTRRYAARALQNYAARRLQLHAGATIIDVQAREKPPNPTNPSASPSARSPLSPGPS